MYLCPCGARAVFELLNLNIADLSTDGCFTLGCAVGAQVAIMGHPILALFAAMAAGVCSGYIMAFLQTKLGVESFWQELS